MQDLTLVLSQGNSTGIVEVQFSPQSRNSSHVGKCYKFTYDDGSQLKIIDPNTYKVLEWLENRGKPIVFMDQSGRVLTLDPATKKWS